MAETSNRTFWRVAYWLLFGIFLLTAALNMGGIRAGFWTSHAADLVTPAWLYIAMRRLAYQPSRRNPLVQFLVATPERAATSLFVASALTELSQMAWPRGPFRGVFDPLDLVPNWSDELEGPLPLRP